MVFLRDSPAGICILVDFRGDGWRVGDLSINLPSLPRAGDAIGFLLADADDGFLLNMDVTAH